MQRRRQDCYDTNNYINRRQRLRKTWAALALASLLLVTSLVMVGLTTDSFAAGEEGKKRHLPLWQHITNDEGSSLTINMVGIKVKEYGSNDRKDTITVAAEVYQDGALKGSVEKVTGMGKSSQGFVTLVFDPPVSVTGDFDVKIDGRGFVVDIYHDRRDRVPGHMSHDKDGKASEEKNHDLSMLINGVSIKDALKGEGKPVPPDDDDGSNPPPPPGETSTVTVKAVSLADATVQVNGIQFEVMQGSERVASGSTPGSVELENGEYTVTIAETAGTAQFAKWQDSDSTANSRAVTISGDITFVALYSMDDDVPPPPPPPPAGESTLTVDSELLDGTAVTGFQVQLRDDAGNILETQFTPHTFTLEPGKEYRVVMYWTDEMFFRHFSDGTLLRYNAVTLEAGESETLTAIYEQIPESQQVKLNIRAKTVNGTEIGGTTGSDEDGTLLSEPGIYVALSPPGSTTPYTAGFTGGSMLPFTIFQNEIYIAISTQAYGKYEFSHWEDDGSTNGARTFQLDGDVEVWAVYNVIA